MSKQKLDYEINCLNETLGTNFFWNRYQSGYVLFENGNFSSEINSAMTYKELLKTIQTLRYCFESKLIKNQVFKKIQDDKQDKVRQQLSSLKGN
tara:strand:+ start:62 stop:343 length:282 start_codon:yes stop_codon:yes gene_type:complete